MTKDTLLARAEEMAECSVNFTHPSAQGIVRALVARLRAAEMVCVTAEAMKHCATPNMGSKLLELVDVWRALRDAEEGTK